MIYDKFLTMEMRRVLSALKPQHILSQELRVFIFTKNKYEVQKSAKVDIMLPLINIVYVKLRFLLQDITQLALIDHEPKSLNSHIYHFILVIC